jgi:hypothetical protein
MWQYDGEMTVLLLIVSILNYSERQKYGLHKEIFERGSNEVGKNKFYNQQKQVKKSSR